MITDPIVICHADYEEGSPETYKGLYILHGTIGNHSEFLRINTGDAKQDYVLMSLFAEATKDYLHIMNSSDVDTFHMEAGLDV